MLLYNNMLFQDLNAQKVDGQNSSTKIYSSVIFGLWATLQLSTDSELFKMNYVGPLRSKPCLREDYGDARRL